ncbi:hypothetical protein OIU77_027866 [Salix suchowensis]|uniref:Formamidopyrimidine-DNA glycosylase catalytic domain-containing protein n=1 Tax=Salix suchowensis TaxID=1278906 RepID=A0ABQ9BTY7_9ROSI|nr:hypothetical protein OIU77_027866 [Salix suchowensis]
MPELPEVEAARRAIEEHCTGKKIKKAIIAEDSKVIDGVSPSDFVAALVGKTIVSAHRKGKNLWLQLDSPPFPSFQFGMAGAVYIKGVAVTKYKRSAVNDSDDVAFQIFEVFRPIFVSVMRAPALSTSNDLGLILPVNQHAILFLQLDDGLELSFTDKRRFAKVRLLEDPASKPPISELGPDALLELMTVDELHGSLSKKKIAIKALLLDQSFVSGIGNWIADEVLYQARIHPLQIASSLSRESTATIHKCIKEVIEKAVEVGADSSEFPNNWIFHSREKKSKKTFIDGKEIDFIVAGGRTTAYVPGLQKLNGNQAGKAVGKPKARTSRKKRDGDDDDNDKNEDGGSEPASEEEKKLQEMPNQRES